VIVEIYKYSSELQYQKPYLSGRGSDESCCNNPQVIPVFSHIPKKSRRNHFVVWWRGLKAGLQRIPAEMSLLHHIYVYQKYQ
jgi:hypothetical protein